MLELMGVLGPDGPHLLGGGLDEPTSIWMPHNRTPVYYRALRIPGLLQVTQDAGCICSPPGV